MAEQYQSFDLGRVIQTAEAIKGMRREAENDKLRNAYMGAQQQALTDSNRRENEKQSAEVEAIKARHKYLVAQNVEQSKDPVGFIRQFAPELISDFDSHYGAGSFEKMTPDQVKSLAGQIKQHSAAGAGISLMGSPEQQFAATNQREMAGIDQRNRRELAGIQHGYNIDEIRERGKFDTAKAGATADRNTFKDTQGLRKEFEGMDAVKQYRSVLPIYERARSAPNNRAGDISVVYALGKIFDPTSAVKEGEVLLSKDAAPWVQKLIGEANSQLTGQGAMSPETRASIIEAINGQVEAFRQPYEQERSRFAGYAQENGWQPDQVVGRSSPSDAFNRQGGGQGGQNGQRQPQQAPQQLAPTNRQGWALHQDANGNKAYVGPNGEIEEVR